MTRSLRIGVAVVAVALLAFGVYAWSRRAPAFALDRNADVNVVLVTIDTLRAERARAVDEAARLQREMDALRQRLNEASTATAEAGALREERELIRNRVVQMIAQIDKLNL